MLRRRSVRDFKEDPLNIEEVSMLLWAAGGIVEENGFRRTAPSAGATYPLELYVFMGERAIAEAPEATAGVYRYRPEEHALVLVKEGDERRRLALASFGQRFILSAPISIAIFAEYERTVSYYGERGYRYVHFEAGHSGQNIYLMATALGLGTVAVGAFDDSSVRELAGCSAKPLYIFPVGRPKKSQVPSSFEGIANRISAERSRSRREER